MIRVTLPGRTLGIVWSHPMTLRPSTLNTMETNALSDEERDADEMRRRRWKTVCTIHMLVDGKIAVLGERYGTVPVAQAIASTNYRDHFDKEIGRKISLTRALHFTSLTKAERAIVWQAYRTRPRRQP